MSELRRSTNRSLLGSWNRKSLFMDGKLGILDWGIGGIGVHKLIKERRPKLSVVYFSDTGVTPYGKMSRAELVARLNLVIGYLKTKGVSHLVIGCNAASTVIPFLDPQGLKIEGIIDAAVEMSAKLKPTRLGLIGGRRTILSMVYRKAFGIRGINVEQRIAQPLSGSIESGDTSSEKLLQECKKILAPLKNCSHILLACTHYPAIIPTMTPIVSEQTAFIDPAEELAKRTAPWRLSSGAGDRFYTSGDVRGMTLAAANAFGVAIRNVRSITINK